MKVQDVMKRPAASCGLESTLGAAIEVMRKNGCGFLPVLGEGGNVVGVITDRDICIALGTRDQKPSGVRVRDVMLREQYTFPRLFTCAPDDDIHCVLKTMRMAKIRRLPVCDREGNLVGILSMDDIALCACAHATKAEISCHDVVNSYRAIIAPCRCTAARGRAAA